MTTPAPSAHPVARQRSQRGWSQAEPARRAGLCVRLVAEEAGLDFLPLRDETVDFCYANSLMRDPRGSARLRLLRSRAHRQVVGELPGYDAKETGEVVRI